jgi:hypothetical protein
MGCPPRELGRLFTALEYHQLLALWASGELQQHRGF